MITLTPIEDRKAPRTSFLQYHQGQEVFIRTRRWTPQDDRIAWTPGIIVQMQGECPSLGILVRFDNQDLYICWDSQIRDAQYHSLVLSQ